MCIANIVAIPSHGRKGVLARAGARGWTGTEITRAIESLQRRKTLLVVTQRLSTVRHSDRLVSIADRRICARGRYCELMMREVDEFRRKATARETRPAG